MHQHDAVGDGKRLLLVVGHVDHGDPDAPLEPADLDAQPLAHLGVEVGERLVQQEHAWLHDERARQRYALLLTARQRGGSAVRDAGSIADLDQVEGRQYPRRISSAGTRLQTQTVGDIVEALMWGQRA